MTKSMVNHINRADAFIARVYQLLGGLKEYPFDNNDVKGTPWKAYSSERWHTQERWMDECVSIQQEGEEWCQEEDD